MDTPVPCNNKGVVVYFVDVVLLESFRSGTERDDALVATGIRPSVRPSRRGVNDQDSGRLSTTSGSRDDLGEGTFSERSLPALIDCTLPSPVDPLVFAGRILPKGILEWIRISNLEHPTMAAGRTSGDGLAVL